MTQKKRFEFEFDMNISDNLTDKEYDLHCDEAFEFLDLINNLNKENEKLFKENEELKQFQEKIAEVIESEMGDNVCNDYKMEVLKEIWNELELDEVWF